MQRVLRTSVRVLTVVSLALTITAWSFAGLGFWAPLLGVPPSRGVEIAVATALTIFAAGNNLGLPIPESSPIEINDQV